MAKEICTMGSGRLIGTANTVRDARPVATMELIPIVFRPWMRLEEAGDGLIWIGWVWPSTGATERVVYTFKRTDEAIGDVAVWYVAFE